jgi:hypothetical protein
VQIACDFAPTAAESAIGDERGDDLCHRHAIFLALELSFRVNGF